MRTINVASITNLTGITLTLAPDTGPDTVTVALDPHENGDGPITATLDQHGTQTASVQIAEGVSLPLLTRRVLRADGLPDPEAERFFVVDEDVARALPWRSDLLYPVTDEFGHHTVALVRPAPVSFGTVDEGEADRFRIPPFDDADVDKLRVTVGGSADAVFPAAHVGDRGAAFITFTVRGVNHRADDDGLVRIQSLGVDDIYEVPEGRAVQLLDESRRRNQRIRNAIGGVLPLGDAGASGESGEWDDDRPIDDGEYEAQPIDGYVGMSWQQVVAGIGSGELDARDVVYAEGQRKRGPRERVLQAARDAIVESLGDDAPSDDEDASSDEEA